MYISIYFLISRNICIDKKHLKNIVQIYNELMDPLHFLAAQIFLKLALLRYLHPLSSLRLLSNLLDCDFYLDLMNSKS